ncbi:MAG: hypothetical protein ACNA8W_21855, partial [Bradymonadaceae bacterium]
QSWVCTEVSAGSIPGASYRWEGAPPSLQVVEPRDAAEQGTCELPGQAVGVAWELPGRLLEGPWTIERVTENPEHPACRSYLLDAVEGSEDGWQAVSLCGPSRLHEVLRAAADGSHQLRLSTELLSGPMATLEIGLSSGAANTEPPPATRLVLMRGYGDPAELGVGRQGEPTGSCTPAFDSCLNTWLDAGLRIEGRGELLLPGEVLEIGQAASLWLERARYRAVVVGPCETFDFWSSLRIPAEPGIYVEALLEER